MKINMDEVLKHPDGRSMKWPTAEGEPEDATLRRICMEACGNVLETDRTLSGGKKAELWAIAVRLQAGGVVDLNVDDVKTLKDRVGAMFGAFIVGPAFALLDPPAPAEAESAGAAAE